MLLMDNSIMEILSPSKRFKAVIYQRKDNLLAFHIYKWLITDEEVQEEYNLEEGYWAIISQSSSITNEIKNAEVCAIEELRVMDIIQSKRKAFQFLEWIIKSMKYASFYSIHSSEF
jgi:hypothetical protein